MRFSLKRGTKLPTNLPSELPNNVSDAGLSVTLITAYVLLHVSAPSLRSVPIAAPDIVVLVTSISPVVKLFVIVTWLTSVRYAISLIPPINPPVFELPSPIN